MNVRTCVCVWLCANVCIYVYVSLCPLACVRLRARVCECVAWVKLFNRTNLRAAFKRVLNHSD